MKKLIAVLTLMVNLVNIGFAQEFLVADGSSSGTYQLFLKQIIESTPDSGITFKEVPSSGAIENLDKLINNEVMGAFMHSDVLFHRSKAESGLDEKYRTLLALFPEDVHFVAWRNSLKTTGGVAGFGAKPVIIQDIVELSNQRGVVGAAGGGFITANVIKL
jgi:hypothetical protein